MKDTKFKVEFTTGETEIIDTIGKNSAKILAQAEQIKKGHSYDILSITIMKD